MRNFYFILISLCTITGCATSRNLSFSDEQECAFENKIFSGVTRNNSISEITLYGDNGTPITGYSDNFSRSVQCRLPKTPQELAFIEYEKKRIDVIKKHNAEMASAGMSEMILSMTVIGIPAALLIDADAKDISKEIRAEYDRIAIPEILTPKNPSTDQPFIIPDGNYRFINDVNDDNLNIGTTEYTVSHEDGYTVFTVTGNLYNTDSENLCSPHIFKVKINNEGNAQDVILSRDNCTFQTDRKTYESYNRKYEILSYGYVEVIEQNDLKILNTFRKIK